MNRKQDAPKTHVVKGPTLSVRPSGHGMSRSLVLVRERVTSGPRFHESHREWVIDPRDLPPEEPIGTFTIRSPASREFPPVHVETTYNIYSTPGDPELWAGVLPPAEEE